MNTDSQCFRSLTRHIVLRLGIYLIWLPSLILTHSFAQAADATVSGSTFSIPVVAIGERFFNVDLTLVEGTDPVELELGNAVELFNVSAAGASSFDGTILSVPRIILGELNYTANLTLISESPIRFRLASANLITVAAPPQPVCVRPDPDVSQGIDKPAIVAGSTVPNSRIFDGGPGPDGIPPIESPKFTKDFSQNNISGDELVVGVKIGDDIRAYPHNILNWHEVINDQFSFGRATLSYCPLTGSAMLWESISGLGLETFGTSGLLYNSNLVMYDRRTRSLWSQMLEQSISGPEAQRIPDRIQVVETTWNTWESMYPETTLMLEDTGFSRQYSVYPYGSFREDQSLLFPVDNMEDGRLHRKERIVGINVGDASKVYPIESFANNVEVINDTVGAMSVVATGSSDLNFGVIYNRELGDCTVLDFQAVQNNLPVVMMDNEGNGWDIFGTAISGARTGQALQKTNSYIAYWYAWTAFFDNVEIHQQ